MNFGDRHWQSSAFGVCQAKGLSFSLKASGSVANHPSSLPGGGNSRPYSECSRREFQRGRPRPSPRRHRSPCPRPSYPVEHLALLLAGPSAPNIGSDPYLIRWRRSTGDVVTAWGNVIEDDLDQVAWRVGLLMMDRSDTAGNFSFLVRRQPSCSSTANVGRYQNSPFSLVILRWPAFCTWRSALRCLALMYSCKLRAEDHGMAMSGAAAANSRQCAPQALLVLSVRTRCVERDSSRTLSLSSSCAIVFEMAVGRCAVACRRPRVSSRASPVSRASKDATQQTPAEPLDLTS